MSDPCRAAMKRFGSFAAGLLLAGGCAVVEKPAPKPVEPPPAPPAVVPPPEKPPEAAVRPRKRGPIPVRPLNVKAQCQFRDETGYHGAMQLHVAEAKVALFEASVDIPRRGSCRFALKDFRQTTSLPSITLKSLTTPCVVRMWEQDDKVTVAFSHCERECTNGSFVYLWPFLADSQNGTCG